MRVIEPTTAAMPNPNIPELAPKYWFIALGEIRNSAMDTIIRIFRNGISILLNICQPRLNPIMVFYLCMANDNPDKSAAAEIKMMALLLIESKVHFGKCFY